MYDKIAGAYDIFNQGFDYSHYLSSVNKALSAYENPYKDKIALDCGCGTGSLISLLLKDGFDCTGIDISPDMLCEAAKKPGFENVRLICQDLSEIDLFRAYNIVFCSLDTINHLIDKAKVKKFFKKIYNFLENEGFLVFDTKTETAIKTATESQIYSEDENYMLFSGTYYKPYANYTLTIFSPEENNPDFYIKKETQIAERFYTHEEIREAVLQRPFKKIKTINYKDRTIFIYRKS